MYKKSYSVSIKYFIYKQDVKYVVVKFRHRNCDLFLSLASIVDFLLNKPIPFNQHDRVYQFKIVGILVGCTYMLSL